MSSPIPLGVLGALSANTMFNQRQQEHPPVAAQDMGGLGSMLYGLSRAPNVAGGLFALTKAGRAASEADWQRGMAQAGEQTTRSRELVKTPSLLTAPERSQSAHADYLGAQSRLVQAYIPGREVDTDLKRFQLGEARKWAPIQLRELEAAERRRVEAETTYPRIFGLTEPQLNALTTGAGALNALRAQPLQHDILAEQAAALKQANRDALTLRAHELTKVLMSSPWFGGFDPEVQTELFKKAGITAAPSANDQMRSQMLQWLLDFKRSQTNALQGGPLGGAPGVRTNAPQGTNKWVSPFGFSSYPY